MSAIESILEDLASIVNQTKESMTLVRNDERLSETFRVQKVGDVIQEGKNNLLGRFHEVRTKLERERNAIQSELTPSHGALPPQEELVAELQAARLARVYEEAVRDKEFAYLTGEWQESLADPPANAGKLKALDSAVARLALREQKEMTREGQEFLKRVHEAAARHSRERFPEKTRRLESMTGDLHRLKKHAFSIAMDSGFFNDEPDPLRLFYSEREVRKDAQAR